MLRDLSTPGSGASLYVGHDTNLDGIAVMLDLSWPHPTPYPANTTVPGGILRLTTEGEGSAANVSAAFLYTDLTDESGKSDRGGIRTHGSEPTPGTYGSKRAPARNGSEPTPATYGSKRAPARNGSEPADPNPHQHATP